MMDVFLVWDVSIEIPFERARFWCEHGIDNVFHRLSAQSVRGKCF
jgi:peroxiredoxin